MPNPVSPSLIDDKGFLCVLEASLYEWAAENRTSNAADNRAGLAKEILGTRATACSRAKSIAAYVLAFTDPQPNATTAQSTLTAAITAQIPTYLEDHPYI